MTYLHDPVPQYRFQVRFFNSTGNEITLSGTEELVLSKQLISISIDSVKRDVSMSFYLPGECIAEFYEQINNISNFVHIVTDGNDTDLYEKEYSLSVITHNITEYDYRGMGNAVEVKIKGIFK